MNNAEIAELDRMQKAEDEKMLEGHLRWKKEETYNVQITRIKTAFENGIFGELENRPKDLDAVLAELEETPEDERDEFVQDFESADWS